MAANSPDNVINVFRIPHSRMKELVESHLRPVNKITRFSSSDLAKEIDVILQEVYQAMWELKSHEYIENHFIMDRLKARLQARKVYNQLVCNCHEDSKLLGVIRLVEKVYAAKSESERDRYGLELQEAIEEFLKEFLEHMEEEEKVFQPLLNENFEVRELAVMNEVVLKQHHLFREKVRSEKSLTTIKRKREDDVLDEFQYSIEDLRFRKSYCQEVEEHCAIPSVSNENKKLVVTRESKQVIEKNESLTTGYISPKNVIELPKEMISMIFSHLEPDDLLRTAQVCKGWNKLSMDPILWKCVLPSMWAQRRWTFEPESYDPDCKSAFKLVHASSNESLSSVDSFVSNDFKDITSKFYYDRRVFKNVIKYLLPKVGQSVETIVMSSLPAIRNSQVRAMLELCPNLKHVDLSYTRINFRSFKTLAAKGGLSKLENLNLEGCIQIDDRALQSIEKCFDSKKKKSKLRVINLSGCREITSVGIATLQAHQKSLEEMDVSGCYMVDGETLTQFVLGCPRLKPDKLWYCSDIEDGPFPLESNGCCNLECDIRFCCQQFKY